MSALLLSGLTWSLLAADGFVDTPGKHLDLVHQGRPVFRYMYAYDPSTAETLHDTYKVYHHVFDETGARLLTKGPGGQFTHHRGLFIGFSKTAYGGKSYDLWHMKNGCSIEHAKVLDQTYTADKAMLKTLIHWKIAADKPILAETRTLTAHFGDTKALLVADWTSELKAVAGEVKLAGDPEHAGVQFRPDDKVSGNKSAKYVFPTEKADPKKDKDLPWVALTFQLDDDLYTVQHMRHPSDPADSVWSAYRDYGRFGNYFVATVPDGETRTLKYRVRITKGPAPSREELAAQFAAYASH